MSKNATFKLAELFCGPGGLSLGLIRASATDKKGGNYAIEPIWANDIDEDSCKTYANNIHDGDRANVVCAPVEAVDFGQVPNFDVLAFGFPCNDFSIVGKQKGFSGEYGPLYTYGVKAINAHKPKWFIAENVGGAEKRERRCVFSKDTERFGTIRGWLSPYHPSL